MLLNEAQMRAISEAGAQWVTSLNIQQSQRFGTFHVKTWAWAGRPHDRQKIASSGIKIDSTDKLNIIATEFGQKHLFVFSGFRNCELNLWHLCIPCVQITTYQHTPQIAHISLLTPSWHKVLWLLLWRLHCKLRGWGTDPEELIQNLQLTSWSQFYKFYNFARARSKVTHWT